MYANLLEKIRELQRFGTGSILLHAPVFEGNEKKYVLDAIDSTFVSSVGAYVVRFEKLLCGISGSAYAVPCVNGTCALALALFLAGVRPGSLVLTQSLTFVATANAISHMGAEPVFLDVDRATLGLSPEAVREFLEERCDRDGETCRLRSTGQKVAACLPMHTFGLPCDLDALLGLCGEWGIPLVEDAAEALGSLYKGRHCGTLSTLGILSFNGNKTVTTGGGGAVLTSDPEMGARCRHLSTTAKLPHPWEFRHDAVAWNFRMPNLNAALGCAQLEQLESFLRIKRRRAEIYAEIFRDSHWEFVRETPGTQANYWLCAVLTRNRSERDAFLQESNDSGLMTRPIWEPLHTLPMYAHCLRGGLAVTADVADRLVNLPSGVGLGLT